MTIEDKTGRDTNQNDLTAKMMYMMSPIGRKTKKAKQSQPKSVDIITVT